MAAAYWWGLPRLYVGPLSLKQCLRRCCRLKGSLSMESHSIAIRVNGTRIVADGHAVTTIEGLADPARLTPLQQAFHERHALQCGFCTPGMIFAAQALLDYVPNPTEAQVRQALHGNLCRCTGYQNIVDAVLLAAKLQQTEDLRVVEAT